MGVLVTVSDGSIENIKRCNISFTGKGHTINQPNKVKTYLYQISFISLDIIECDEKTDNCDDANGICTNTIGSFTCTCKEGYEGDGVRCRCK